MWLQSLFKVLMVALNTNYTIILLPAILRNPEHQVAPLAVTHLKLTLDLIIKSIWAVCPLCELFLMPPPEKTLYLRLENKRVKFTAA